MVSCQKQKKQAQDAGVPDLSSGESNKLPSTTYQRREGGRVRILFLQFTFPAVIEIDFVAEEFAVGGYYEDMGFIL
jgi:hypothetical protein